VIVVHDQLVFGRVSRAQRRAPPFVPCPIWEARENTASIGLATVLGLSTRRRPASCAARRAPSALLR
jgi:hypothetical protein